MSLKKDVAYFGLHNLHFEKRSQNIMQYFQLVYFHDGSIYDLLLPIVYDKNGGFVDTMSEQDEYDLNE